MAHLLTTRGQYLCYVWMTLLLKAVNAADEVSSSREDVYDFLMSSIEHMIGTTGPCSWLGPSHQVLHYTVNCVDCWCDQQLGRYQCHEARQCDTSLWPVKRPLIT
ncbi:uncharacterized protein LOC122386553 [Amphibalanus amphitrite]|uniref:uncharacterized protein LOC122386553 n=1 Tax=Amphibalanus amphitrite TaxID=1232801 RepID=UPI001C8FEB37|nr:uncharacterized protein LOC122386553 [Amphibalanus amphitrite]